jgi:hypothetical protein
MVSLTMKARDAWWTVVVIDPIAGTLVRLVSPVRRVTPNLLTLVSAVVAAGAVAAFAVGWLVVGALLFQASFVIDCMDGKLASLREQFGRYGGSSTSSPTPSGSGAVPPPWPTPRRPTHPTSRPGRPFWRCTRLCTTA